MMASVIRVADATSAPVSNAVRTTTALPASVPTVILPGMKGIRMSVVAGPLRAGRRYAIDDLGQDIVGRTSFEQRVRRKAHAMTQGRQ